MRPKDRRRRQAQTDLADKPKLDGFAAAKMANITTTKNKAPTNSELPGRRASRQQTATSIRGTLNRESARHLTSLFNSGLRDDVPVELDDDMGVPEERTPENLPAIISTAIANTDETMIIPKWHQLKNLHGYRAQQIRALGRQIFEVFTDTPIEDIQACTTLSNDTIEVQAMMAWIKKNGVRNDKMEMDFDAVMPGYKADVQNWDVEGFSFLLVRDDYGHYVWGWPGGRGVHLEEEPPRPMLR